jgi:hypothetical protein
MSRASEPGRIENDRIKRLTLVRELFELLKAILASKFNVFNLIPGGGVTSRLEGIF